MADPNRIRVSDPVCQACGQQVKTVALHEGLYRCPACVVWAKTPPVTKSVECNFCHQTFDYTPIHVHGKDGIESADGMPDGLLVGSGLWMCAECLREKETIDA